MTILRASKSNSKTDICRTEVDYRRTICRGSGLFKGKGRSKGEKSRKSLLFILGKKKNVRRARGDKRGGRRCMTNGA